MIASDPMVWRKDLDPAVKAQVKNFLLGYGKVDREQQILQTIGYSGFRPSANAQLVPIRQIELARERSKLEADTGMAADERAKKLKEIDGKLTELSRVVAQN
jgi:phosphonate transport system substrate-binding protein